MNSRHPAGGHLVPLERRILAAREDSERKGPADNDIAAECKMRPFGRGAWPRCEASPRDRVYVESAREYSASFAGARPGTASAGGATLDAAG